MTEKEISADVYSKMQTGDPVAVYKKGILGKVWVEIINPFSGTPETVCLEGNPKKNNKKAFVEVWSKKEEVFFDRQNEPLFKEGYLIKLNTNKKPKEVEDEKSKDYSKYTREYLEELVTAPFLKFQKELNDIESEAVLYRLEDVATDLERPEKTMQHIRRRISEVQNLDELVED